MAIPRKPFPSPSPKSCQASAQHLITPIAPYRDYHITTPYTPGRFVPCHDFSEEEIYLCEEDNSDNETVASDSETGSNASSHLYFNLKVRDMDGLEESLSDDESSHLDSKHSYVNFGLDWENDTKMDTEASLLPSGEAKPQQPRRGFSVHRGFPRSTDEDEGIFGFLSGLYNPMWLGHAAKSGQKRRDQEHEDTIEGLVSQSTAVLENEFEKRHILSPRTRAWKISHGTAGSIGETVKYSVPPPASVMSAPAKISSTLRAASPSTSEITTILHESRSSAASPLPSDRHTEKRPKYSSTFPPISDFSATADERNIL